MTALSKNDERNVLTPSVAAFPWNDDTNFNAQLTYLPVTAADRQAIDRKNSFKNVLTRVRALKTSLLESREARKLPEVSSWQSSSTEKLFTTPPVLNSSTSVKFPSGNIKSQLNDSPPSSTTVAVRPHPLSSSSSTPNMGVAAINSGGSPNLPSPSLSRQATSAGIDRSSASNAPERSPPTSQSDSNSSRDSASSRTRNQRTSGPNVSSASASDKDEDDLNAVAGSMTFVTELDYQDLVEQTAGRTWPKILNLRKMASQEESNASELFKNELDKLNVQLIKPSDLVFHSLLGRGSSANVYQGTLTMTETSEDAEEKKTASKEVAIKILNTSPTDLRSLLKAHKETMDELIVMQRVQSPHVVRLFGITTEPSICIVLEFCHKGSLYDVLCTDMRLNWAQCFEWFREIALGTLALHASDPPIVHRDLKTLNLLVDDTDRLKVADFGLSRLNEGSADQLATLQRMRGTYIYCAPEIYFGLAYTPLSDVYSIGLIFWELVVKCVTGQYQRPFGEYPAVSFGFQVVIMASRRGTRPTVPACPKVMQTLLTTLWSADPSKRPSCLQLISMIDEVEQEYQAHKDAWDAGVDFAPEFKDEQLPPAEMTADKTVSKPAPSLGGSSSGGNATRKSNSKDSFVITAGSGANEDTTTILTGRGGGDGSTTPGREGGGSSQYLLRDVSPLDSKGLSSSKLRKTTKASLTSLKAILPSSSSTSLSKAEKDKEKEMEKIRDKEREREKEKEKEREREQKEKDKALRRRSQGRPANKHTIGGLQHQFEDLLTDQKLYRMLEAKLSKEHAVEYLHFYRAAAAFGQKFTQRSAAENLTEAKYIETLLCNVSGDERMNNEIKTKIANSNPDHSMFSELQGEVASIIRTKFLALMMDLNNKG